MPTGPFQVFLNGTLVLDYAGGPSWKRKTTIPLKPVARELLQPGENCLAIEAASLSHHSARGLWLQSFRWLKLTATGGGRSSLVVASFSRHSARGLWLQSFRWLKLTATGGCRSSLVVASFSRHSARGMRLQSVPVAEAHRYGWCLFACR